MRAVSCLFILLAILLARNSLAKDSKGQDQHQHIPEEGKSETDDAVERIRRQIGGFFGGGLGAYGGRPYVPFGYPNYGGPYGGGPYLGHPYGPYFQERRVIGGGFGGGFYGR